MKTLKEARKQTMYNKVVNISKDGEITVLDYIFYDDMHGKPFNGATGSKFYPVSKEEHDNAIEDENMVEYLIDSGIELSPDQKRNGFVGVVAGMSEREKAELMFDHSYMELWDYLREVCELDMEGAYIFNCVGGGRCFDAKFQGNVNPELSELIRKAESK